MTEESVSQPKYGRGENPASRANLKAPWQPGETGHSVATHSGPLLTPAIRRLADKPMVELREYVEDESRPSIELIAGKILVAAYDGSDRGVRVRQQLLDRLDGTIDKLGPPIAVQVNLTFGDGEQA